MLIAFTAVAALVMGVALKERLGYAAEHPIGSFLRDRGSRVTGIGLDRAAPIEGGRVVPVAGAQRTAFNRAAQAIRPAVLSLRASFDRKDAAGRDLERTGSALVVDTRGYAVTCHHVVVGATRVLAQRFRGEERWLPARLIAAENDLALLELRDDAAFVAAQLGDSEAVRVGDWVLAVGHPFGLGLTVTAGIVGRRRATLELPGGRVYDGLLQTDAPINEGSSGGPLIDASGRVVGLNTAIYAPTGVFSGAGFAIPSNRVRKFVERALGGQAQAGVGGANGGWGLVLADLEPSSAPSGALVTRVVPGSPAAAAELAAGDIVTSIAGQAVSDVASVRTIRDRMTETASVPIRVWRRGSLLTLVLQPRLSAG